MVVVVKSKARNRVKIDGALESAFWDDDSYFVDLINDIDFIAPLYDANGVFEEVEDIVVASSMKMKVKKNICLKNMMMTMIMFPIMNMKQIVMKMIFAKSCEFQILFISFLSLCKYVLCIIYAMFHYFYRCCQEEIMEIRERANWRGMRDRRRGTETGKSIHLFIII